MQKNTPKRETPKFLQHTPTDRIKAEFVDATARYCLWKDDSGEYLLKTKFHNKDLLPFLRQEHDRWDAVVHDDLINENKCIQVLSSTTKANLKKRNWLAKKMEENKERQDLRDVKMPDPKLPSPQKPQE